MELIYTDSRDERFAALCRELDDYLSLPIGSERQAVQYNRYNSLNSIHNVALILENGKAVACGGFKEYAPGVAEIKRVFTKKDFRNRGYGKDILKALETRARDKGYTKLILETGVALKAARNVYIRMGFHTIKNYEPYTDMPDSVCMEKIL